MRRVLMVVALLAVGVLAGCAAPQAKRYEYGVSVGIPDKDGGMTAFYCGVTSPTEMTRADVMALARRAISAEANSP